MSNETKYKFLLEEKSFFSIYLKARKIPESKFNTISTCVVFVLFLFLKCASDEPLENLRDSLLQLTWSGFLLSFSILGFLIAGFTIFATVSKPELFLAMAEIKDPRSRLPKIKHNYFIFMRVFGNFFILSGLFLMLHFLSGEDGFIDVVFSFLYDSPFPLLLYYDISIALIATSFYLMIIQLKSFVFNIYHSVMTSLVWQGNENG